MTRLMAMAAVLGLFAVGVLTGGFSVHLYHGHGGDRSGHSGGHRAHFMEHLDRELELSSDQREQLEGILHDAFTEGESLRREFLPQVHERMNATREKIHALLTAEQRTKFEEMHREHRDMAERFLLGRGHRRRGERRPPGPPPPPPAD